jgi:hypothetical protein
MYSIAFCSVGLIEYNLKSPNLNKGILQPVLATMDPIPNDIRKTDEHFLHRPMMPK